MSITDFGWATLTVTNQETYMSLEELSANTTLYVRTTGNDTTGDGTSGSPYATLGRAIERIEMMWFGDYTLTIDLGEGMFTETAKLTINHPQGEKLLVQGVDEDLSSVSVGSIDTSLTSGTYYYYNVTLTLPVGKSVSVGDYIIIRSATGGTNPKLLLGCHEVTAWNSGTRVATVAVRVYSYDEIGSSTPHPLPSGSITCNVTLSKTAVNLSNDGLEVTDSCHGGTWNHLVICKAGTAITLLNNSFLGLGSRCAVKDCDKAVWVEFNSTLFADYAYFTGIESRCIRASCGSSISVRYAVFSATEHSTLSAELNSTIWAQGATFVNCAGESDGAETGEDSIGYILDSQHGSVIQAPSAEIIYPTGWALCVTWGSHINVTSLSLTSDYDVFDTDVFTYNTVLEEKSYIQN
jgi:hypothetical protein